MVGPGARAVVAPEIEDFAGEDFLFYRFGYQVEDFDAVVQFVGEIGDVGSEDREKISVARVVAGN